jgi:hypothetical protein
MSACAWALALAVACGGNEFSAMTGGESGSLGSGGASGVGSSDGVGGSAGTGEGTSSVAAGGTSGASVDASSDQQGSGGQGTIDATSNDATSTRDAIADVDAARDAAGDTGPRDVGTSDVVVTTKCPPTEPNANQACADGLDCTYGTHPRPACRRGYICTASHWVMQSPGCPDLADCLNEPVRPQVGAACMTAGRECSYSMGLYCRCLMAPTSMAATWDCYPPPTGCPASPPNKGQTCDVSFMPCAYGTCPLGTRVSTSCSGAIVRWTIPVCPVP